MKRRIYGLETEYGIALTRNGNWFCEEDQLRFHLSSIAAHFRENGSRIYLEGNFHPEYCTAECSDLHDLIANDKAGERILKKIFSKNLRENEKIMLFKNNVDYAEPVRAAIPYNDISPISMGCHENFLIEKKITKGSLERTFLPFLVARQIVCGAGWVPSKDYQNRGIRYNISQRARFMMKDTDGDTTRSRAIVCTARLEEAHSDSMKYQRFHLIVGDSNMSEFSTYLKMGTVGILLEMLEEGYEFKELYPRDAVSAITLVSRDVTCKKAVIEMYDGKLFSALDVLEHYLEQIEDYKNINGLSPELQDIYEKFLDIVLRLKKRTVDRQTGFEENSQGLSEELDWLIKKSMLEEALLAYDCDWTNFKNGNGEAGKESASVYVYNDIRAKDLKYHEISEDSPYHLFSQPTLKLSDFKIAGVKTPRIVEEEEIVKAENVPPQNTRAKLRGDFIKLIKEKSVESKFNIDWETINNSYRSITIVLFDPFAAENIILSKLSREIANGEIFLR